MGLLDRNEISRGDVVFSGSSALYVMGNNFYVPRKDLVVKGKMTLEIYVIPGDFRKILSYKFSFRKRPR